MSDAAVSDAVIDSPVIDAPVSPQSGESITPAEPVVPPPPTPEQNRERLKGLELAAKRDIADSKARKEAAAYKAERDAANTAFAEHKRQADEQASELARIKKVFAEKDLDGLASLGVQYPEWTRHNLQKDTPAAIAARAVAEVEALRKERDEERQQAQLQAQIRESREVAHNLVRMVDEAADEFPELYAWPPERVAEDGERVRIAYARQHGKNPTYNMVLGHLAQVAKNEATVKISRLAQRESRTASVLQQGNGQPANKPNAPTLTNAAAATKATPPRPKTDAEVDEECLAQLRALNQSKAKP